jgi:ketosteroid isomerase-like protein
MSQENVERIRKEFDKFLAGSRDFGAHLLAADVEWDATDAGVLDISRVYHGPEGVAEFWREWLEAWETVQFDYELIGTENRVLALVDQRMIGRATGIEVPIGKYAHLYTFSDGQIVHWKLYRDQSEALRAVGLEE